MGGGKEKLLDFGPISDSTKTGVVLYFLAYQKNPRRIARVGTPEQRGAPLL